MNGNTTISINKSQERLLKHAALRYGFSADELLRRIVADTTRALLEIPEETLDEYENPEEITKAFRDATHDERQS